MTGAGGGTGSRREALRRDLEERLAPFGVRIFPGLDMPSVEVEARRVAEVCETLRREGGFDFCVSITAVDDFPDEPRFQVVHHLASLETGDRLRLRSRVPGEHPRLPSVVPVWPGANWLEREVFDLFGIVFEGHPDLRRILMPDGYGWHPLRKDFPIEGIEPDRLYREWEKGRVGEAEG